MEARRPLPNGYPEKLVTVGDHIRKRRLDLGLHQPQVADAIGVSVNTIQSWEMGNSKPVTRHMAGIIRFLDYVPTKPPCTLGEKLRACRMIRGLSLSQAAEIVGVNASTWGWWEQGRSRPSRRDWMEVLEAQVFPIVEQEDYL